MAPVDPRAAGCWMCHMLWLDSVWAARRKVQFRPDVRTASGGPVPVSAGTETARAYAEEAPGAGRLLSHAVCRQPVLSVVLGKIRRSGLPVSPIRSRRHAVANRC